MTIYFWSDTHFSHNAPFIYESRGFNSVQEHDAAIVSRINSTVNSQDELYLLGDVIMGNSDESIEFLKQIDCHVHIICGNHDQSKRRKLYEDCSNVVSIGYGDMVKYNKWHFFLSHFPSCVANYDDSNKPLKCRTWNLCGHTHTEDKFENMSAFCSYNVGVDAHPLGPIPIEEVIDDIKSFFGRM